MKKSPILVGHIIKETQQFREPQPVQIQFQTVSRNNHRDKATHLIVGFRVVGFRVELFVHGWGHHRMPMHVMRRAHKMMIVCSPVGLL